MVENEFSWYGHFWGMGAENWIFKVWALFLGGSGKFGGIIVGGLGILSYICSVIFVYVYY